MSAIRTNAAAAMLGVSPNTLRSWEQRFGYPNPRRTEGGHRQFELGEIEALREAFAETHNISSAISIAQERGSGLASPGRLRAALAELDHERADRLLEESLAVRSLERTVETVLLAAVDSLREQPPAGARTSSAHTPAVRIASSPNAALASSPNAALASSPNAALASSPNAALASSPNATLAAQRGATQEVSTAHTCGEEISPEYGFAWRYATGWLAAALRVAPPATAGEGVLVLDATRPPDLDALHVQALELFLRRGGLRVLTLPVQLEATRVGHALRALRPRALVLAGGGASLDTLGRLVYSARQSAEGTLDVLDYRGALPDTGASTVTRLPGESVAAAGAVREFLANRATLATRQPKLATLSA